MSLAVEELTFEELARAGETYEPRQRAIAFARRFGSEHAKLALYAALPLGLTPDLVHLLRVNFVPQAPWIAEADLLLSPLCRESGGEFYEMDARVRELLLDEFVTDVNFGMARLRRAAEFLYVYAGRARIAARRRDTRAFWQAQEWTALAYARPEEAARVLASELGRKINEADASEALRVARVTNTLASPLGAHDELVLYAAGFEQMLGGGDSTEAFELFDAAGSNEGTLNVAGVNLPSTHELATRLNLQAPTAPAPQPQETQTQTQAQTQTQTETHAAEKNPRGFTLTQTFTTGGGYVTRLAWSPDGKFLAAPATDSTIYAWDSEVGGTHILQAREGTVNQVAWSPDSKRLAAITRGELLIWDDVRLRGYEPDNRQSLSGLASSVAWSPDGDTLIVDDNTRVFVWSPDSIEPLPLLRTSYANSLVWLSGSRTFAYVSEDGGVGMHSLEAEETRRIGEHDGGLILSLAVTPDALRLAAGRHDGVINIWEISSGLLAVKLEGHAVAVNSLSFSADGRLLASKSTDSSVRLWRTDTWETVAVLDEPANEMTLGSGIAFHPQRPDTLATLDETGRGVRVWRLDLDQLMGRVRKEGGLFYKSANVLIIGDPDSWKSALAQRLIDFNLRTEGRSLSTSPTRSLSQRQLYEERVPMPDGRTEVREVTLINPMGDLTEQLSRGVKFANVSLALFVFNFSYEGLYSIVEHFDAELRRAQETQGAHVKAKRFLVEPRADLDSKADTSLRPGIALLRELNFDGHFKTSALTAEGVDELLGAIRAAIDWDALPGIAVTERFGVFKNRVNALKWEGARLVRVEELSRAYFGTEDAPPESERAEFDAALMGLELFGLLRVLGFGGLVLLRPEELDAAAAEISSRVDEDGLLPEGRI